MSRTTAHGRLRYNTHAIAAAHACVSAKVDSRYPVIDSVLIVSRAESADAMRGSASELALWHAARSPSHRLSRLPGCPGSSEQFVTVAVASTTLVSAEAFCARFHKASPRKRSRMPRVARWSGPALAALLRSCGLIRLRLGEAGDAAAGGLAGDFRGHRDSGQLRLLFHLRGLQLSEGHA